MIGVFFYNTRAQPHHLYASAPKVLTMVVELFQGHVQVQFHRLSTLAAASLFCSVNLLPDNVVYSLKHCKNNEHMTQLLDANECYKFVGAILTFIRLWIGFFVLQFKRCKFLTWLIPIFLIPLFYSYFKVGIENNIHNLSFCSGFDLNGLKKNQ